MTLAPDRPSPPGPDRPPVSGLDALYPAAFSRLAVDWRHLKVPGPPTAFALTDEERDSVHCERRYRRRTIQCLNVASGAQCDRIAFIDKAIPHARFELMAGEVGPEPKATAGELGERALQLLLSSAREFVALVSDADVMRRYGLDDSLVHCALNCDPHTQDRESIQAVKHFHLHYILWTAAELRGLDGATPLWHPDHATERRRVLDPLMTLGASIVYERLAGLELDRFVPGAERVPFEALPSGSEQGLIGCLLRLPDWSALPQPGCARLLQTLHRVIDRAGRDLLQAFTGESEPPRPWHRHRLLSPEEIGDNIAALDLSATVREQLTRVAGLLHSVSDSRMAKLGGHPRQRIRQLSLNLPAYSLNLHSPARNRRDAPLLGARPVYLVIQPKLFSAVGGAGSLPLAGIPSVCVRRGEGRYSEADWQQRAGFQREFVDALQPVIAGFADPPLEPVNRLTSFNHGWGR